MAAAGSSVGVFWGSEGRLVSSKTSDRGQSPATTTQSSSTVQLPQLPHSASSNKLPPQTRSRDDAAISLLEVLHTLLRSIREDMSKFMKSMRAMDPPADTTVHFVGPHGPRYYSQGVAAEDREFFVREREMDADREAALAATALARERHCAVVDKQFYNFDRRKKPRSSKSGQVTRGRLSIEEAAAAAETARIDRHHRKIEHLLHVLQDEIAKETRREIDFLEFCSPSGPGSRQSRRRMALIIKARYEAADRIMRILEEYKIVVGVSAVDYLLQTIAEGKAIMS
ncbi:uncharacterized protein IUM83_18336 [Phytophthora cinnamomi]|uniref:uncharacterized protein n=1 Tax=Phytophthora cinnamomi TaxID=4785 RepID=UPI003559FAB9|nr:hypothetical protein IUM83_18336 [Phytophthora cinnamomi]